MKINWPLAVCSVGFFFWMQSGLDKLYPQINHAMQYVLLISGIWCMTYFLEKRKQRQSPEIVKEYELFKKIKTKCPSQNQEVLLHFMWGNVVLSQEQYSEYKEYKKGLRPEYDYLPDNQTDLLFARKSKYLS